MIPFIYRRSRLFIEGFCYAGISTRCKRFLYLLGKYLPMACPRFAASGKRNRGYVQHLTAACPYGSFTRFPDHSNNQSIPLPLFGGKRKGSFWCIFLSYHPLCSNPPPHTSSAWVMTINPCGSTRRTAARKVCASVRRTAHSKTVRGFLEYPPVAPM